MLRRNAGLLLAVAVAGLAFAAPAHAADAAAVDKAFAALAKYDWASPREPLNAIDQAINDSYADAAARAKLETRLLAVLADGSASRAARQFVCRKLSLMGGDASIAPLAKLLGNKELSHMARYALERIPGPKVDAALRTAAGTLSGDLKIGMINSLSVRRDAGSVEMLIGLLKSDDKKVVAAAAAALGRIGDKRAAGPLMAYAAGAPKADKGPACDAVLAMASALAATDKAQAGKMFSQLYKPDMPVRLRVAALKGLAEVDSSSVFGEIVKALGSDRAVFRGTAASLVKKMPAAAVKFAGELPKLPPAGQVALINALAAGRSPAVRTAILQAAKSDKDAVAVAAIAAVGAVGNAQDVPMLAQAAVGKSDKASVARASLQQLRGKDVDAAVVAAMGQAAPAVKVELLGALAGRNAVQAAPTIVKLVAADNADVSKAAVVALAVLGNEEQIPALVAVVKAPKNPAATQAGKTLATLASRVKTKAVAPLIAALQGAAPEAQAALYNALARAGGEKAFATVAQAAKAGNDPAVRALNSWSTPEAAPLLLEIAQSSSVKAHQIIPLQGATRLAGHAGVKPADALAWLTKVLKLASRNEEKSGALAALASIPTIESFKLLAPYVEQKSLADAAGGAIVRIASKVMSKDKAFVRQTLEKVAANVRSPRTKRRAQQLLGQKK